LSTNVVCGYRSLRFYRVVVHSVFDGHYCLWYDRGVVRIVVVDNIVDHYCLLFARELLIAGYLKYSSSDIFNNILIVWRNEERTGQRH
jgi:hypothetical protein